MNLFMNLNNYLLLCKTCDKFLEKIKYSKELSYLSWLYIIRPHPVSLRDYKNILKKEFHSNNIIIIFFKNLIRFILILLKLIKSFYYNNKMYYSSFNENNKKFDVFIISHFINLNLYSNKDDFYFGKIPEILNNSNYSSLLIYQNPNNYNPKKLTKEWKKHNHKKIILSNQLNFFGEMKILIRAINLIKILKKLFRKDKLNDYENTILSQSKKECLSYSTFSSFRLNIQLTDLIKKHKPKVVMLTYEGFAWERIVFQTAKDLNPKIVCIGYQHACINNYYHSLKRNLNTQLDPDIILTSGQHGYDILNNNKNFKINKISVIGSFRSDKPIKITNSSNLSCIVLPEGYLSETYILLSFSLKCANLFPKINFIWRMHPVINFNNFKKKYSGFDNLPKNIIISENELVDDLNNSGWALYRGSTAIISAINFGLIPIFLNSDNSILIDPLNNVDQHRKIITSPKEIKDIIKVNLLNKEKNINLFKNFSDDYYSDFKKDIFMEFFSKNIKINSDN